jgi:DNA-directed RNA polymerase specialized sigma24 family protein
MATSGTTGRSALRARWPVRRTSGPGARGTSGDDPAEEVADIALGRRELLLRAYRHRLRREELEDCYSQAIVELLTRARAGARFAGPDHVAHAIEQKFASRIVDRRRALAGRSSMEAALGLAIPLDGPDAGTAQIADAAPGVEERVAGRLDLQRLREVAEELSADQRLVLACQVGLDMQCAEFCRRFGWSAEKFRKVAQRARGRLVGLVAEYAAGERCRRLEPDLLAVASRVADPEQARRVDLHLVNCPACRRAARELRCAERRVLALLPAVKAAGAGLAGGGTGAAVAAAGGVGATATVSGSGAVLFGGAGLGAMKLAASALCVASLAGGGLLLCQRAVLRVGHPAQRMARSANRARSVAGHRSPAREIVQSTAPGSPRSARPGRVPPSPAARPSGRATSAAVRPISAAAREFGFPALGPSRAGPSAGGGGPRASTATRASTGHRYPVSGQGSRARGAPSPADDFGFERR